MSIDLRERLNDEAAAFVPGRDLVTTAKVSGRRTLIARRRRRSALGGTVVALVVAVLAVPTSFNVIPRTLFGHTTDPLARFSWTSTKGDLGGDRAFLDQALQTWNSGMHAAPDADRGIFDDLTGPARVIWAGTTPQGPAAVIAQPANLHPHADLSSDDTGRQTLLGFLGTDATGRLAVISDTYAARGSTAGRQVGGAVSFDSRVWVLLDIGEPLALGDRVYGQHGTTMRWTPVSFEDDVAVVQMSPRADPALAYVARQPFTGWDDIRFVALSAGAAAGAQYFPPIDNRLQWGPTDPDAAAFTYFPINGAGAWPAVISTTSVQRAFDQYEGMLNGALDSAANTTASSLWAAGGILPDGRRMIVGERQLDADPSYIWAVVGDEAAPLVINGGTVDRAARIPVRVHLPDGLGWVIVANGSTLSYRTGGGPWTHVGRDAALLPETATQVRATTPTGTYRSDLTP